ncbi:MAG TPA: hypothetical protein VFY13_04450, partial [Luteolibacter sp.]|nr:hypothetical protein [Luteolibacter sp.]
MNWQIFGITGYLSVALAASVVALWVVQWRRPSRRMALYALAVALLTMLAARHNSRSHVSRITIDQSARIAEVKARENAKRQALIKSRSDNVADVQFAEDGNNDAIDTAGMDEADLKYLKALSDDGTEIPEWKKEKKTRGADGAETDDSLEGKLNAGEKPTAAVEDDKTDELAKEEQPIPMLEPMYNMANRLDLWNLRLSSTLFWLALLMIAIDYLRRANMPQLASPPLPLPSGWLNAFNTLPTVSKDPRTIRSDTVSQLVWLTRRGDPWLLFTDDSRHTQEAIKALAPCARKPWNLDLIRVDNRIDDSMIFESLWYGRASFIADDPQRAQPIFTAIFAGLEERRRTKAQCSQTVHVIWNWRAPLPDETLEAFRKV